jgi:hypothetical protein
MVRGTTVPVNYWLEEDAAAPDGEFLLAEIPAEAVPETVLGQLGRLI